MGAYESMSDVTSRRGSSARAEVRSLTISEPELANSTPSTIYCYVRDGLLPPARKARYFFLGGAMKLPHSS